MKKSFITSGTDQSSLDTRLIQGFLKRAGILLLLLTMMMVML